MNYGCTVFSQLQICDADESRLPPFFWLLKEKKKKKKKMRVLNQKLAFPKSQWPGPRGRGPAGGVNSHANSRPQVSVLFVLEEPAGFSLNPATLRGALFFCVRSETELGA